MAQSSTNLLNILADKKSVVKAHKKKHPGKQGKNPPKTVNTEPVANLRRGKVQSNWNLYLSKRKDPKTNKSIVAKRSSESPRENLPIRSDTNYVKKTKIDQQTVKMAPTWSNMLRSTGRCVGIDCEMVGILDGRENMLARVSLVDENGSVLYDTFVKPEQHVVDYRTPVSGVRPHDLENGRDFKLVQSEVFQIINGKLLIGHAVSNDMKVLFMSHPRKYIRDTCKFKKFREEAGGRTPSLRFLASHLLGMQIQTGEHSSVEDARAAMFLYVKYRNSWEAELRTGRYNK